MVKQYQKENVLMFIVHLYSIQSKLKLKKIENTGWVNRLIHSQLLLSNTHHCIVISINVHYCINT